LEASFKRSPEELSTEEAFRFIDAIVEFSNPILVLSGGEPLFRDDIFDIASYANAKGLKVALASNGTLISREIAQKIKEAGIKRVSISLDGAIEQTHDEFRKLKGSFIKALTGFQNLKELNLSLQINSTLAKHNVNELSQMYNLAVSLGADAFHIFMLVPVGCGVEISPKQMLSAVEYEEALIWFYEKSKENNIELKATCAPHYFRIALQKDKLLPVSKSALHQQTRGCLAGSGVFFVSYRGDVFPCGYLPIQCGNVRQQSLKNIWDKSENFELLRDPNRLEGKCALCEFKKVCFGCRARAYADCGNFMAEEPFCVYQPDKHNLAYLHK
jgi:radical SAM protein with 4Fe4S-binding SPASM domain